MRISDWSSDVCSSDLYRCRTAGVTSAATSASRAAIMTISNRFDDVQAEWELLDDWEDRYRLLIDLGRALEPMPDALKTDDTPVRGCSASAWVYPTATREGLLPFLAARNAAITKGSIAMVLTVV